MKFVTAFGAALAGSAIGFAQPLWFISRGYGLAMALQAGTTLSLARTAGRLGQLHTVAVGLYGVRLGSFLAWRDSLPSFQNKRRKSEGFSAGMSLPKKATMWVGCAALYAAMFAPTFYSTLGRPPAAGGAAAALSLYVGVPLMLAGLVWEAAADQQKQRSKERQPNRWCDAGLFRFSRQANYAGELAFWWGSYLTGVSAYASPAEFGLAAIGVAGITAIILGESKRRNKHQEEAYRGTLGWAEYTSRTPVLVPFAGRKQAAA